MRGQVDLHGLHVAEAKECLLVIVPILEQMNVGQVSIITGSGQDLHCIFAGRSFINDDLFSIYIMHHGRSSHCRATKGNSSIDASSSGYFDGRFGIQSCKHSGQ